MTPLRRIFVGPHGIRAGWSFLIFFVIFAGPVTVLRIVAAAHQWMPKTEISPMFLLIDELATIALVTMATAIMAWIEGRSFWSYGLAGRRKLAFLLSGWLGGLASLSLLVAVLAASGYLVFDGVALHGLSVVGYGVVWLVGFLLAGVSEEMLYRGYLQSTLTRGMGYWPAAVLLSVMFGLLHLQNPGESYFGIFQVVVAGLLFALLLRLSGSLWLGIGFHGAWDWAQSFLYGTPDSALMAQQHWLVSHPVGDMRMSGGAVGPEGSLLQVPATLVGLLLLIWVLRRAGLFVRARAG